MPDITRRRLLGSAAAGAGGVLASSFLPPALARAASEGPRRGSLRDVKHVVIHMQENRSFDHYFGTLGGVAGFGDPNALVQTDPTAPFDHVQGKSIFYQYDPYNPDNYLLPWHLDTLNTSSQAIPSTSHAWYYQQPWNTAFSSDGSTAYVTNSNDNTVSVINTATQKVTKTIPLGSFTYTDTKTTFTQPNQIPTAIALAPDNRYMWVACNVSGSLAIIDTTTNTVTSTAQAGLGTEPTAIAFA